MTHRSNSTRSGGLTLSTCAAAVGAAIMAMTPMMTNAAEAAMTATKSMTTGQMDHSKMGGMSMTGDVDYDFAANMRMHHQNALDMSQAELKNGVG